jgi:hypothetical protein
MIQCYEQVLVRLVARASINDESFRIINDTGGLNTYNYVNANPLTYGCLDIPSTPKAPGGRMTIPGHDTGVLMMSNHVPKFYDLSKPVPGRRYFMVSYYDDNNLYPEIETYIFSEKNLLLGDNEREKESWCFQTPDAYLKYGFFSSENKITEGLMLFEAELLEVLLHDFDDPIETLTKTRKRNTSKKLPE